jgi:hypothetical protein
MATEAQVQANRLNARKSTGPRTAQGKEKASQNSVTHGLFAREGVIRGEDREEFEMHREMLRTGRPRRRGRLPAGLLWRSPKGRPTGRRRQPGLPSPAILRH